MWESEWLNKFTSCSIPHSVYVQDKIILITLSFISEYKSKNILIISINKHIGVCKNKSLYCINAISHVHKILLHSVKFHHNTGNLFTNLFSFTMKYYTVWKNKVEQMYSVGPDWPIFPKLASNIGQSSPSE